MTKTITIGGTPIKMTASAATAYRFKQIFKADILKELAADHGADTEAQGWELMDMATKLAFVMQAQAGEEDVARLSEESFLTWLDGFAPTDFLDEGTLLEILRLFNGDAPSVEAKKNTQPQPGN